MILPYNISFEDWAASVVQDFPLDIVPVEANEDNWKEWANYVAFSRTFSQNDVPGPDGFDDWHDWAERVYQLMA